MQLTNTFFQDPALTELLCQLRSIYPNGGAEFAQFQVDDLELAQWFADRTGPDEVAFVSALLQQPTVMAALTPLQIQSPLPRSLEISPSNALTLDGELAQRLISGGAHQSFTGNGTTAKVIGQKFCTALFGDRYEDVTIYQSHTAWTAWFGAVGWDNTWVGLDRATNQVWIFAITDID